MTKYRRAWDDMLHSTAYKKTYKSKVDKLLAMDVKDTMSHPKLFTAFYNAYMRENTTLAELPYNEAVIVSRLATLETMISIYHTIEVELSFAAS